ncbi:MAG: Uma2 family endonuclease [Anaerolineae bacterium]|nr:Uma2 family endonuclease [Anaerolineae bacterium]
MITKTVKQTEKLITAEALWSLGDAGKHFELVKGELIQMTPPGGTHGQVAVEIAALLRNFVKPNNLGKLMVETGYRLAADPDTVRSPDVSFLSAQNVPSDGIPEGYITGPPDLAIEIVSPGDTATEIQDKVQDYLQSGTKLVWIIYPQQQVVVVHYPDGTAKTLSQSETLSGEDVVPGFTCSVKEIFS